MAVSLSTFPFKTPYDPSADPATSVDPLGTNSVAEQFADLLLPGFTARMWRARLLTFSAVASLVAERAVDLLAKEDLFDSARLTFERLYVSALVRASRKDPKLAAGLVRVPGTDLAQQALREDEPLTRLNFVKGQSVNGPTGVMARLARRLQVVDAESHLDAMGQELVLAWSRDEGLVGILEGLCEGGEGPSWLLQMAKGTRDAVQGKWPGAQSSIWAQLTDRLRPDHIGRNERRAIHRILTTDATGLRRRTLHLLVDSVDTYNLGVLAGRTVVERDVLQNDVRRRLTASKEDQLLDVLLAAIDVHEQCSSLLLGAFNTIRWALSSKGALTPQRLLADKTVATTFERIRKALRKEVPALDASIDHVSSRIDLPRDFAASLRQMRADIAVGSESASDLLATLLARHARVQKDKHKGDWIVQNADLTLMPGFGFAEDPATYSGLYMHPFRIGNAYSMLGELGVVKVGANADE
jgi:hypothetical protein